MMKETTPPKNPKQRLDILKVSHTLSDIFTKMNVPAHI